MALNFFAFMKILLVVAVAAQTLQYPPPQPASYPSVDQLQTISGNFLTDPLVANAVQFVKSRVSAELLAVKPAKFTPPSVATYTDDPVKYCYYPGCIRTNATKDWNPEIFNCPNANDWGVSYDDGPISNGTDLLLVAMQKAKYTATFFAVGSNIIQNPQILQAAYNQGNQIAIHTWSHHTLTTLTNEQIVAEIKYSEAIIHKTIGKVPIYMRPPYADMDDRVRAIISALGYKIILWSDGKDTGDAAIPDNANLSVAIPQTVGNISSWFKSQSGFISLQHDISPTTCQVAVNAANALAAAPQPFPLNPIPIGHCLGVKPENWYVSDGTFPPAPGFPSTNITEGGEKKNGAFYIAASVGFLVVILLV